MPVRGCFMVCTPLLCIGAGHRGGGSTLPWAAQLESALALLRETLRSPVEYESTPVIAALMQASQPSVHPAVLNGNLCTEQTAAGRFPDQACGQRSPPPLFQA